MEREQESKSVISLRRDMCSSSTGTECASGLPFDEGWMVGKKKPLVLSVTVDYL